MGVSQDQDRRWRDRMNRLWIALCYVVVAMNGGWIALTGYGIGVGRIDVLLGLVLMGINGAGVWVAWMAARSTRARGVRAAIAVRIEPVAPNTRLVRGEILPEIPAAGLGITHVNIGSANSLDMDRDSFERHWRSLAGPNEILVVEPERVSAAVLALSRRVTPEVLGLPIPTVAREILVELRELGRDSDETGGNA